MNNNDEPDKSQWYDKTKQYWENSESSIKGVLGGNDQVHDSDVKTSCELIEGLIAKNIITPLRVLDCGAGIGRVTTNVLQNYFEEIDIMEQDEKFIDHCKTIFKDNKKVKNIYKSSLQDFIFKVKCYMDSMVCRKYKRWGLSFIPNKMQAKLRQQRYDNSKRRIRRIKIKIKILLTMKQMSKKKKIF